MGCQPTGHAAVFACAGRRPAGCSAGAETVPGIKASLCILAYGIGYWYSTTPEARANSKIHRILALLGCRSEIGL